MPKMCIKFPYTPHRRRSRPGGAWRPHTLHPTPHTPTPHTCPQATNC
ncbi:MAG: hypothetical protein F6J93_30465 [Oscillatoria sp. SIO1A7]|nr:hypothetical protein [Oscillatoria sp. SIO1A7]